MESGPRRVNAPLEGPVMGLISASHGAKLKHRFLYQNVHGIGKRQITAKELPRAQDEETTARGAPACPRPGSELAERLARRRAGQERARARAREGRARRKRSLLARARQGPRRAGGPAPCAPRDGGGLRVVHASGLGPAAPCHALQPRLAAVTGGLGFASDALGLTTTRATRARARSGLPPPFAQPAVVHDS